MQAFTDVPVSCCDCNKTFLSASSLLQHFAEHVKIKLAKDNYNKLKLISKRSYRKCFLNNNINNHNNSDEDGDGIRNHVRNIVSEGYVQKNKDLDSTSSVAIENNSTKNNFEISIEGKPGAISDLIETSSETQFNSNNDCTENIYDITACKSPLCEIQAKKSDNLISNPNSDVFNNNVVVNENGRQFCVEFNSEKMLINIERLPPVTLEDRKDIKNINNNEILNEDYDKFDDNNLKRKLSNRKQMTPKKIDRSSVSLVKIAPKPKDMPPRTTELNRKPKQKKKYSCHLCSKTFGWSTDLKRHILVHTGERPFKCNKCDACFTRNFLLQKHKNKIHSNNKDMLERNKLLEEKVNENLKQLKTKLNELSKPNFNEDCTSFNVNGDEEKTKDFECVKDCDMSEVEEDVNDEEMIYTESKLDIKEETNDPLSFSNDLHQSINQQHFVNGKWVLANNNNNNNNNDVVEEKMIKYEPIYRTVLVETIDKT